MRSSAKYSRLDGRKPPSTSSSWGSYLSGALIVVLVALCVLGVWMMNSSSSSSSVDTAQNADVSTSNEAGGTTQLTDSIEDSNAVAEVVESSPSGNVNQDKPVDESPSTGDTNNPDEQDSSPVEENQEAKPVEEAQKDGGNENQSGDNGGENKPEENPSQTEGSGGDTNPSVDNPEENKPDENSGQTEGNGGESSPSGDNSAENKPEENSVQTEGSGGEVKSDSNDNQSGDNPKPEENSSQTEGSGGESQQSSENPGENKPEENTSQTEGSGGESNSSDNSGENKPEENSSQTDQKVEEKKDDQEKTSDVYPTGQNTGIMNETTAQNGSFTTQAAESKNEKEVQQETSGQDTSGQDTSSQQTQNVYNWKLCNTSAGSDFIPCLDNLEMIKHLKSTKHFEHRERQCPSDPPTCLVPIPQGYKRSIPWPSSRDKIWYHNVPHPGLAEYKKDQNWVKVTGEYLTFPGGGTQFKHGALYYIDNIQTNVPDIAWGKRSRVILDVGCGVASFGGFLFERDVLTMSLAPKDEHEAQVQFALERGIPAVHNVMGTKRLPFPGKVFDVIHCARCRVPWHIEGGKLLLELNRLLRPGGFFVWSATPIYDRNDEDTPIWEAMKKLTKAICWELVQITTDKKNSVGIAFYRKPLTNDCYDKREETEPPFCPENDDPNAAWNVTLQACLHKVATSESERGSKWPEQWPARVEKTPYWLSSSKVGEVYGKPAPEDFKADYEHWKEVVSKSYMTEMGINWANVRNIMDMRAVYGGFAAALKDLKVWVMNVVSVDDADTLPIIYDRGLIGSYHDWCESFNTYPRTYDLLHANQLFSTIKKRCNYMAFIAEVDRVLRPEGKLIVRDTPEIITELESMLKSMQWEIRASTIAEKEGVLFAEKSMWRPNEIETLTYAVGG